MQKDDASPALDYSLPAHPPNYKFRSIADLFKRFESELEGVKMFDPCGDETSFNAENFPHLIKLEFYNQKIGRWVDAKATMAVEQLHARNLDESKYRIGDSSRPRTLFWIPDIVTKPDEIHNHLRDQGRDIYSKRYKRDGTSAILKIVLVAKKGNTRAVITSFCCSEKYHRSCVKDPARYSANQ